VESDRRTIEVTAEITAALALAARLPVDPSRLEELAGALSLALEATWRLEEPASRISPGGSLDFDPSWDEEGRRR
jgi:hypothetical protein